MKKLLKVLVLFLAVGTVTMAQKTENDRIGLGVSYVGLDAPDDPAFLPKISYQHQFQPRFFASADVGYLHYKGVDNTFRQVPELRKRFTVDLAARFSLFKFGGSHLGIAAGPSLWYVDDQVTKRLSFVGTEVTSYELQRNKYWSLGTNVSLQLDIRLSRKLSVMGNIQFVKLTKADLASLLGLYAFYRIK